jgi:hypothetical protein
MTFLDFIMMFAFVEFMAIVLMIVPALVGVAVVWQTLVMPKKAPMDKSNRINHIRLVWFSIAHPQKFVGLEKKDERPMRQGYYVYAFPWLTKDEQENVG